MEAALAHVPFEKVTGAASAELPANTEDERFLKQVYKTTTGGFRHQLADRMTRLAEGSERYEMLLAKVLMVD